MSRSSILAFCVDQMQATALACAGHPDVKTPNLDRLAGEGVRFSRAYCENPLCTPSRLSLLTGLSSRQHGVYTLGSLLPPETPTVASVLKQIGYRTHAVGKMHIQPWGLERRMGARGERAACLDGLHSWEDEWMWLDGRISSIPSGWFGFDHVDYVGGHTDYIFGDYLNWLEGKHPRHAAALRDSRHKMAWSDYVNPHAHTPGGLATTYRIGLPAELHYNSWIADRSIDFLRSLGKEEPFFLWCSFPDPHHPFAACAPYSTMYDPESVHLPENANALWKDDPGMVSAPGQAHSVDLSDYNETALREMTAQTLGMISHVDACIGRVWDALRDQGRDDDTAIVFLSDHGEYLGAHGLITKGYQPYEEILRVPYIWRAPRTIKHTTAAQGETVAPEHGAVESGLASLMDFAPTVLDFAGVSMDRLVPRCNPVCDAEIHVPWFDGISLRPFVEGAERSAGDTAGIDPERALIVCKEDNTGLAKQGRSRMVRTRIYLKGRWKLVIFGGERTGALYDLEADPLERANVWNDPAHSEVWASLLRDFAFDTTYHDYLGVGRVSAP